MLINLSRGAGLFKTLIFVVACSAAVVGCASKYRVSADASVQLPSDWQTDVETGDASWSALLDVQQLEGLLQQAIERNPALKQRAIDVEIARSLLRQKKLQYWPSLSLGLSASRGGVQDTVGSTSNSVGWTASSSYELNLWGQLSDQKKAAGFGYSAAEAEYEHSKRELVENVSNAWLDVVENQLLVALRAERLKSLRQNLAIIESGYQRGINKALEVYLSRNNVERERALWVGQQQSLSDSRRTLKRLVGDYPDNTYKALSHFPETNLVVLGSIPAQLLARKPEIQVAWLSVLQQSSVVAVAHKARFPSFSLSASVGEAGSELAELNSGALIWSVGGSLIQPLISSGRLKLAEDTARLNLQRAEQNYIDVVNLSFQEVESRLERQLKLQEQFGFTQNSADNAIQAEKLAFDQYQRGIVDYPTVLEAQRRSVDAQIQLISLKKQIISNKVALLNAVDGDLDFEG